MKIRHRGGGQTVSCGRPDMTKQQSLVAIWETRLQMIRSHFFLSYPWRRTLPLSAPVTRITAARGQSLARNTALGLHVCTVHQ